MHLPRTYLPFYCANSKTPIHINSINYKIKYSETNQELTITDNFTTFDILF